MKVRLVILFLLAGVASFAQPTPGKYTPINVYTNNLGIYARSLNLAPHGANDTVIATGQWPYAGAVIVDSVNHIIWFKSGDGHWHQAGGSSGGSFGKTDTIAAENRYLNQANYNFSFKNGLVKFSPSDSVGNRFSYSWATNPLSVSWTDNTATATVTTTGSKTTVAGGAFNLSNHLDLAFYTGVENWTITQRAIVVSKSSTTFGLGVLLPASATGGSYSQFGVFNLADTAGYITYGNNSGSLSAIIGSNRGGQNFIWAAGDTFSFQIQRRQHDLTLQMTNERTGQMSTLTFRGDYQSATVAGTLATISLYFFGGTYDLLGNFVYKIDELSRPTFLITGNSTVAGFGASAVYNRWPDRLMKGSTGSFVVNAGSGERTTQALLRVSEIRQYIKPRNVIFDYGINDLLASVSAATFGANVRSFMQSMRDSSINVIILSLVPQTVNVATFNDTLSHIATDYGFLYVNITTSLTATSGTAMNTAYTADNIHPNDIGYEIEASTVKDALAGAGLLIYSTAVNIDKYPKTDLPKYMLGLDDNNNLIAVYNGSSNEYLQNRSLFTNDGITVGSHQNATLNITGSGYIGQSFYVKGAGSFSNPTLRADSATNTVSASLFTSQNLTTTSNATHYASGYVYIEGTAQILAYQKELSLLRAYPNSGSPYSVVINNGREGGGTIPSTYKILELQENSVERGYIDTLGGYHAGSASGYITPYSYAALSNTSWPTKRHVDSLFTANASLTNPMTTAGDLIVGGLSGTPTRLAAGTNSFVLTSNGAGVAPSWQAASAGSGVSLSALAAAAATNDIDNTQYRQRWRWTTLAGDTALVINSTNTTAASNAQVGIAALLKGANATSTQTTSAIVGANTHTGTGAVNYGLYGTASGGTDNYSGGFNERISVGGATVAAGATDATGSDQGSYVRQTDNNYGGFTFFALANYGTKLSIGAKGLYTNQDFDFTAIGGDARWNVTRSMFGTNTDAHSTLQSAGSFATAYVAKTANYTLTSTDHTVDATSGTFTLTLPTAASITGREYVLKNTGSGTVTIATTSSQTIDGFSSFSLVQYMSISVMSNGSNWAIIRRNENTTSWGQVASTGITNTAGTWTNDRVTGKSGGGTVVGGTAANDILIIRGTLGSSGNTGTSSNMNGIVGDGAGTTAWSALNNGTFQARYLTGTTSIGTITAGTGAGTSPTVSVSGTDLGGTISVTTGTLPTLAAAIATINFGNTYPSAPRAIVLTAANANSATLSGVTMVYIDVANITTGAFVITAGATALTAATAYKWFYTVIN